MDKIKFGVSINKVGALIVYNFKIRTNCGSVLDKFLHTAREKLFNRISGSELLYISACAKRSRDDKYITYDFSSCNRHMFFEVLFPIIRREMLNAEVKNLTEKYKSLHVDIQVQDLPDEELMLMEEDYWDGDDSCEL